jgi:uncharacterized membrane protein
LSIALGNYGKGDISLVSQKPHRLATAVWYAIFLWLVGFVWGMIVFMVPLLKNVPSIPHVSKLPAVSFVLLPVYLVMLLYLARRQLYSAYAKGVEALKFGIVLVLVAIALDTLVYVLLLGSGDYFAFLSIWVAYAMFLLVPWFVGRYLEHVQ